MGKTCSVNQGGTGQPTTRILVVALRQGLEKVLRRLAPGGLGLLLSVWGMPLRSLFIEGQGGVP